MKVNDTAKPFLKWAGGKRQLLSSITEVIPKDIIKSEFIYIEAFVGAGALLIYLLQQYPKLKAVINDINIDLINSYQCIQEGVDDLIILLKKWEKEYHLLTSNHEKKKKYYYSKRKLFNRRTSTRIEQTALLIFLNRTCFNGLYRVNKKNEFNVPIGSYKAPMICDEKNLKAVSKLLQNVTILNGDFEMTIKYAKLKTLFYFDPPYKPLSTTASFNSYAKNTFDDAEQIRLLKFCEKLDLLNHSWILNNADVKSENLNESFFDKLYGRFNIKRVIARRSINSNPNRRGELTELLITNMLP